MLVLLEVVLALNILLQLLLWTPQKNFIHTLLLLRLVQDQLHPVLEVQAMEVPQLAHMGADMVETVPLLAVADTVG